MKKIHQFAKVRHLLFRSAVIPFGCTLGPKIWGAMASLVWVVEA